MAALPFSDARATVLREVRSRLRPPGAVRVALAEAQGRILAEDVVADRDYPPFDRAMRDGFAIHAEDIPGTLRLAGEVRAGAGFSGLAGRARLWRS